MIELDNINYERSCGDCSMCCEGFLAADIHGYQMMQGVPCHFKAQSSEGCCSIYDNRPPVCVNYKCLYMLSPKQVPEWMKPNRSDVILGLKVLYYISISLTSKELCAVPLFCNIN